MDRRPFVHGLRALILIWGTPPQSRRSEKAATWTSFTPLSDSQSRWAPRRRRTTYSSPRRQAVSSFIWGAGPSHFGGISQNRSISQPIRSRPQLGGLTTLTASTPPFTAPPTTTGFGEERNRIWR